jgi:hypothetical protein
MSREDVRNIDLMMQLRIVQELMPATAEVIGREIAGLEAEVARLREGLAEIAGPDTLAVTFVAGDGERALRVVTSQEYAQHILDEETDR